MSNLWWQNHRLLQRGARGPDVERMQRALNDSGYTPRLVPDGDFGGLTEAAVIWFQGMMNLVEDGKLGPVTQSVLVAGSYRFELSRPPHVPQGTAFLCWAACLESVLKSSWLGRPQRTVADLQSDYSAHLNANGGIGVTPLRDVVGADLRFRPILDGEHVRAESLLRVLGSRKPIILIDNSTGGVMHARVVYGVQIRRGAIDVLMMDPLVGHVVIPIGSIQALTRMGFFAPNEVPI